MIRMSDVESSQIAQIGYDVDTRTMVILFHAGGMYKYSNVEPETYNQIVRADSIGSMFSKLVRNNEDIPYEKITARDLHNL